MKNFLLANKYIIGLVLVVLLSLWQLSLFFYISKWDNIDAYLPYRYFVSDCFWNGALPLWNPFQNLGTPVYSDLQSGTWHPVTWIIMLFGKYTIGSLTIEILLCYIIAALGFYKLGNFIYDNKKVSFVLGLSYALSGFMVGSSQLLPFLIGIAWLPWIIFSVLSFLQTLKYKYALLTALFLAICTSGASPPFIIILVYTFAAIFVYYLWKNKDHKTNLLRIILGGGVIVTVAILLLLPLINSFFEFLPYFNRAEKLPFEKLSYNNFTFYEYISFIFPFSVLSDAELFKHTDLTLRNGYFGIIGLVYLMISCCTVRNKYFLPLIVSALLSLLLAAGSSTYFYKLVYEIPGFAVFKHASFFKIYFIFSCLLLAGFAIKKDFRSEISDRLKNNTIKILGLLTALVLGVSVVYAPKGEIGLITENIVSSVESFEGGVWSHLAINGMILIMLISIWFFVNRRKRLFPGLVIILIFDLFIQTQLSAPKTIFNKIEHTKVSSFFNNLPRDINQDVMNLSLKDIEEKGDLIKMDGFWRNLPTLNKTISYHGYNPMRFKSYDKGKISGELDQTILNPIMFFEKSEDAKIDYSSIGYNKFEAGIKNNAADEKWFLLNQNYHANWKATFAEGYLKVHKINDMIMGVKIPAKSMGEIQFKFSSLLTGISLIISLLTYLALILFFILDYYKCKKECALKPE